MGLDLEPVWEELVLNRVKEQGDGSVISNTRYRFLEPEVYLLGHDLLNCNTYFFVKDNEIVCSLLVRVKRIVIIKYLVIWLGLVA